MIANGILSLASAISTIIGVGWIMTTAGLVAYFLWNLLMIFMMVAIYHDNKSSRQLYVV